VKVKKLTRKVECVFCHKPFHPKGVHAHQARCNERFINAQSVEAPRPTYDDLRRAEEKSFKDGQNSMKQRYTDVQIKALEAAAKVVDAIAHMVGELR
jgi:hypothetical protein